MAITTFRSFANHIRQPAPYFPILSEAKGAANLLIGSLQLAISVYMRYSTNPYHNGLTDRHIQIGTDALKQSAKQFTPALLAGAAAYGYYKITNGTLGICPDRICPRLP